jgi:hypothetical protein
MMTMKQLDNPTLQSLGHEQRGVKLYEMDPTSTAESLRLTMCAARAEQAAEKGR